MANERPNGIESLLIATGGEMGRLIAAFDWEKTSLGPISQWPHALRTTLQIMLSSRYAMWIGWGDDLVFLYNDAYARVSLGRKHPDALGRLARDVWPEIWDEVGPRTEAVLRTGQATWDEALLLYLERQGFSEESYHTFSYSPIADDQGKIAGMLCVVSEDTERVIGERRLRTLREVAASVADEVDSIRDVCVAATSVLQRNPQDLPFLALYLVDANETTVRRVGLVGQSDDSEVVPETSSLHASYRWPFQEAFETGRAVEVDRLSQRFGEVFDQSGTALIEQAIVIPLATAGSGRPIGLMVAAISPRRPLDESYRGFLELLAKQLGAAITNVLVLEEERIRLIELAESERWEREQAEARLRSEFDMFQMMADAAPVLMWICGPERKITWFNKPWLAYAGRTMEEELGDGWMASIHENDVERCRSTIKAAFDRRRPFSMQYRLKRHDGKYRWLLNNAVPHYQSDGSFTGYLGSSIDITENLLAQEAIRESELHFRNMADNAPTILWVSDAGGECTYLSKRWYEFTGGKPGSALGLNWLEHVHPEDTDKARLQFLSATRRKVPFGIDYRLQRHDQTYRWMSDVGLPRFDDRGQFLGFIGTVTDIHERKTAEETLRNLADDLAESNRRKTEFLATLGHELRNPLAPIRTGLELMKMAADDPAVVEQTRSMMERQTQQMVRLIDDLLDVSRISRGKLELRRETIVLQEIVAIAVEASKPFIDESMQSLEVEQPETPIKLFADPNRMSQVVSNLLNNAAKYTPKGGRITLTMEAIDDEAMVIVRDTGIGIASQDLDRIFDMFAQLKPTLDKVDSGLGIGLTLVKFLVEMHGGTIEAASEGLNRGSEFTLRLPIESVVTTAPHAEQWNEMESSLPKRCRVLVADDNVDAAETLGMLVRMMGSDVQIAADGRQAIAMAEQFRPNVILMDIGMPHIDGYEATRQIRRQTWGSEAVIVALTGWGQEEDRRRSQEAGFDGHLTKPAEPAELQQILANPTRMREPAPSQPDA